MFLDLGVAASDGIRASWFICAAARDFVQMGSVRLDQVGCLRWPRDSISPHRQPRGQKKNGWLPATDYWLGSTESREVVTLFREPMPAQEQEAQNVQPKVGD